MDWKKLLEDLAQGRISEAEAAQALWEVLGRRVEAAHLDLDRVRRRGVPEVVYGEGKAVGQIEEIVRELRAAGQPVLITRVTPEQMDRLEQVFPELDFNRRARIVSTPQRPPGRGLVCVVSAGTADRRRR